MPANKGRFVAYYCVSTDRNGNSAVQLQAHRKSVLDYLGGGQRELVAEFTEIESGKRRSRPELQKAIAACKRQESKLIVAKLDPLFRNVGVIATLMHSGVEWIAVDNPHMEKVNSHITAVFAEYWR
jgi:DNA invertase Pin-like site-specific DNA recombinase